MAQVIKWATPTAIATPLDAGLNALANGAQAVSAAIDNLTDLYLYAEFELYLAVQGVARSAGAYVSLYLLASIDGANYSMGDGVDASPTTLIATLALDAATTARYVVSLPVAIPPASFKILLENNTGQAFNAAGNTLKMKRFNLQGV